MLQIVLVLEGPDEPVIPPSVTRDELEFGVRTMATGGIDGALKAVNEALPAGFELRRVLAGE